MQNDINVFVSALSFEEEDLRGKIAVMIDVMRASSTIVTALNNGAKEVIPVIDMDEAGNISQNLKDPNFLLCGEKGGIKIEGYDLGNSPHEYSPELVEGKSIIFNTTNGTKALKRSSMAQEIYVGSFLNLESIVRKLKNRQNEIILVCAGWKGRLSLEDLLCAGNIIYELTGGDLPDNTPDGTKVAFGLFKKFGNDILKAVKSSNHAQRLKGIVGSEDIEFCCRLNVMNVLPKLEDGVISDTHGK